MTDFTVRPVGYVRSPLTDPASAPKQGHEGAPEVWIHFDHDVEPALTDLAMGDEVVVLTWLHLARRDILRVHPRDDLRNPETGVFATRSADRPNPIGLHVVTITATAPGRLQVSPLEAVDGTPVLDVKPSL